MRALVIMAMVFPASANKVNLAFAIGPLGQCMFDDAPFAQLFHSLRPRGSPTPAGNALERLLIGTWSGRGLSQRTFYPGGHYSSESAGSLHGSAISREGGGSYTLRGSEVTVTSRAGQPPERFRVDIYDKWNNSGWQRAMTVLYDDGTRPLYAVEYVRAGL
jgi:hypothetical protein